MKRNSLTLAAPLALGLASCTTTYDVGPVDHTASIASAVAQASRPDAAREQDAARKPVETLAFLGLAPGMDAADLIPGGGYWSEIMAHVVGADGSVTALQPEQFYGGEKAAAAWAAMNERAGGITLVRYPFEAFSYQANSFDFAIMNLNYHDLYWTSEQYNVPLTDPDKYVAALYDAMRPGGVVGIIDHVGKGTDTRALVEKTHRIDPSVVRADFERAGFVFDGSSDILANPDDNHEVGVFNAAVRGKTDRFIYRFRKPAS